MEHYQAAPLKYRFNNPFLIGFICVVLISLLRYSADIFGNETWAEESTDFLVDEMFKEIGIFTPAASTLFVLERISSKFALTLSPLYAPAIIHAQCFLVYALVAAYFSRQSFRWLVPSDVLRIGAGVLIAMAPGSNEVIANIPCLPYVIAFGLALTLVEDPRMMASRRYRWGFAAVWIVGTLSSHISAALLPLSLIRVYGTVWGGLASSEYGNNSANRLKKSSDDHKASGIHLEPPSNLNKRWINASTEYLILTLPVVANIANLIAHTIIALNDTLKITTPVVYPFWVVTRAIVGNFLTTAILAVVSGFPATFPSSLITIWESNPSLTMVFSSALAIAIFFKLWRTRSYMQSILGIGLFLCIWFLFLIHSVARGSYLQFLGHMPFTICYRHFWLPYALSLVAILGPFLHWARGFSIKWGVYVLLLSAVCSSMLNISFTRQPKQVSWGEFIKQLEGGAPSATLTAIDNWAIITVIRDGDKPPRILVNGGNR